MSILTQGSFTTNPTYSGSFIPTVWSGKLNVKFYATTVFGEIANTSYEGDIKSLGDTVIINNIPSITINTYTIGQTLTYQVPAPSKLQLNISKAKYFGVNVSDVLEYQSQPKLMDMFTNDAAKQMAISIDTDILLQVAGGLTNSVQANGLIDPANQGATAGVNSGRYNLGSATAPVVMSPTNIVQLVTSLASVLDEQNVPDTERYLVISPYVRNVLMSSPLAQAYVTGDGQSILRNGKIGSIDRFTIYVSNLLPSAAAGQDFTGANTGGNFTSAVARNMILAGHKTGLTFASQIVKVESLQNPNDFGSLVRGLNIYGYQIVKQQALAVAQVQ